MTSTDIMQLHDKTMEMLTEKYGEEYRHHMSLRLKQPPTLSEKDALLAWAEALRQCYPKGPMSGVAWDIVSEGNDILDAAIEFIEKRAEAMC